jgi:hypothetical protein
VLAADVETERAVVGHAERVVGARDAGLAEGHVAPAHLATERDLQTRPTSRWCSAAGPPAAAGLTEDCPECCTTMPLCAAAGGAEMLVSAPKARLSERKETRRRGGKARDFGTERSERHEVLSWWWRRNVTTPPPLLFLTMCCGAGRATQPARWSAQYAAAVHSATVRRSMGSLPKKELATTPTDSSRSGSAHAPEPPKPK